ncbi:MAG: hypothetical protein K2Q03_10230 [Sphingobacteriaceae bacterium]|nr:hypothetical protein [Sphingobacteriaceae bacterium]
MKVMLDIKDNKADFVMELLRSLPFVKAEQISPANDSLSDNIKAGLQEVRLFKKGELKTTSAKDFLSEL